VIARQRSSAFQLPSADLDIRPPGKNWPQGFYKCHPELKTKRVKALDWARYDHNIYDKILHWFAIIGRELSDPAITPDNVYNMDETGILLNVQGSLKVLISDQDSRNYRGAGVKRELVTAIEYISADRRFLNPLIIWPASTHRSPWTTHETPGWHYVYSKTGYTNTEISLYWIQHVLDPLTKARANHKPRILINDGLGTHESPELMRHCLENRIVLCGLGSHTSHLTQPLDVALFSPLKTAYRGLVGQRNNAGIHNIGKSYFTLLYDQARKIAFTTRNIHSGWSKTGLHPFNPARVLDLIRRPQVENIIPQTANRTADMPTPDDMLPTPVTYESLTYLRTRIEQNTALDSPGTHDVQKLANTAEKAFAERTILREENRKLYEHKDEKTTRQSVRSTTVGKARIMAYEDIGKAEQKRAAKEASAPRAKRDGRGLQNSGVDNRSRAEELEDGQREIEAFGMEEYFSVSQV